MDGYHIVPRRPGLFLPWQKALLHSTGLKQREVTWRRVKVLALGTEWIKDLGLNAIRPSTSLPLPSCSLQQWETKLDVRCGWSGNSSLLEYLGGIIPAWTFHLFWAWAALEYAIFNGIFPGFHISKRLNCSAFLVHSRTSTVLPHCLGGSKHLIIPAFTGRLETILKLHRGHYDGIEPTE